MSESVVEYVPNFNESKNNKHSYQLSTEDDWNNFYENIFKIAKVSTPRKRFINIKCR